MSYTPFSIGTGFRIVPPDTRPATDGRLDLVMQRGAFGSGEHETTRSCLECLEDLTSVRGARLLDLGSGTGILAIAALRLGATHAVCLDVDPRAVATARHNCRANGVDSRVTHITGTLEAITEDGFDIVLANIYGDILLGVALPLTAKLRPGGLLLLSGILWEDNYAVRQAYINQGCRVIRNRMLEEFSTVLLEKN